MIQFFRQKYKIVYIIEWQDCIIIVETGLRPVSTHIELKNIAISIFR